MKRPEHVLTVADSHRLTPYMQRVVLTADILQHLADGQESAHLKLMIPTGEEKPLVRTYTVRKFSSAKRELTIDFALHDHGDGPAARWAKNAKPGDPLTIGAPGPVKLVDRAADWFLLVSDMTGLPALACNLELMPEDAVGHAVIEVTSEADQQQIAAPKGVQIHWVINATPHLHSETLVETVKSLPWGQGTPSIWSATEFHSMRKLRDYFRTERQVGKDRIYISSYWKIDRTEEQHKKDKAEDERSSGEKLR